MTVTVAPETRNIDRDEGAATLADRLIGVKVGDVVRLTTIPTGLTPANPSAEKWRVVKIDEADSVYTFGVAPSEQEEEDIRYWAYAVEPLVKDEVAFEDPGIAETLSWRVNGISCGDQVRVIQWWQHRPEGWLPDDVYEVKNIDATDPSCTFLVKNLRNGEMSWGVNRVFRLPTPVTSSEEQKQTLETEAETGRVYTDVEIEEIRREVRADMQRRSDERLREFKQSIVEKVLEKARQLASCGAFRAPGRRRSARRRRSEHPSAWFLPRSVRQARCCRHGRSRSRLRASGGRQAR